MSQRKKHSHSISTKTLADRFDYEPATIRRNYCVKGHFLGLKPIKLPNTRLLWPDITPEELAERG